MQVIYMSPFLSNKTQNHSCLEKKSECKSRKSAFILYTQHEKPSVLWVPGKNRLCYEYKVIQSFPSFIVHKPARKLFITSQTLSLFLQAACSLHFAKLVNYGGLSTLI